MAAPEERAGQPAIGVNVSEARPSFAGNVLANDVRPGTIGQPERYGTTSLLQSIYGHTEFALRPTNAAAMHETHDWDATHRWVLYVLGTGL